ncbi:hypothetical protein B9479_000922 [Cryptococcus floricola]|uniref:Probable RNA polymerase II nuclear localization protein SLC7A6OS n=1 Tax=Cryptococcus floricola TaxID=2591691 RepID=A0A5D3B7R8_9TREE|nr:hypothetical protein B9479_000922 [Cryptococcus floricola]
MDIDPSYPLSPAPHPSSYTVLRIKRKATDQALSSLVIQDESRAKRRRDIAGRPRGVFRLADTVPGTWIGEGEEGKVLKTRIQGLLSSGASPSPVTSPTVKSPTAEPPAPSLSHPTYSSAQLPPLDLPSSHEPASTSAQTVPSVAQPEQPPVERRPSQARAQMQYRVIPPMSPRTKAMMPPRLITAAETEGRDPALVFVDAQAVEDARRKNDIEEDKEVAAFLPMLQEYLKLEEEAKQQAAKEESNDDWVYDLYYRDTSGSVPLDLGVGDGVSIGQLLGLEDGSPPSSVSGSEPEDEADEDSNDEDYYRNDYPEDEDADEDMMGFRGGDDDSDWSEEEQEDDYDRDEWGYRD